MISTLAIKIIAGAALLIALVVGYNLWAGHQQQIGEDRATIKYNGLIEAQKVEAAKLLAAETEKVRVARQALDDTLSKQGVQDAKNQRTVSALTARLRDVRLRDPNARPRDCGDAATGTAPTAPGDSTSDSGEASGFLSERASDFLRGLMLEADNINIAFIAAKADGEAIRKACGE